MKDMKMRTFSLLVGLVLATAVPPSAMAYENYIPLGTGYSSNVDSLPSFDSEAGQISQQADIYESEIYRQGREQQEADSRFRQFFSNPVSTGAGSSIDY
jgi:hypothetical protein